MLLADDREVDQPGVLSVDEHDREVGLRPPDVERGLRATLDVDRARTRGAAQGDPVASDLRGAADLGGVVDQNLAADLVSLAGGTREIEVGGAVLVHFRSLQGGAADPRRGRL
jgi:hypothetical protein